MKPPASVPLLWAPQDSQREILVGMTCCPKKYVSRSKFQWEHHLPFSVCLSSDSSVFPVGKINSDHNVQQNTPRPSYVFLSDLSICVSCFHACSLSSWQNRDMFSSLPHCNIFRGGRQHTNEIPKQKARPNSFS